MTPVMNGRAHKGDLTVDCDVVVVGSGASGAVIAAHLAEAGQRVIVLDEGPFIPALTHGAMRPSESLRHMWRSGAMTVMLGLGDTPAINVTMGRGVGGSSALTGGVCFRIPEHILHRWRKERGLSEFSEAHLEPFYADVERSVHVEEVPAHMQSLGTRRFVEGATKNGAVMEPMRRNTEGCNGCGRCNFGCPHGAKLSVDLTYLPRAAAKGAQIISDCLVHRVRMEGNRAVGVEGRLLNGPKGKAEGNLLVHAKRVVLAAGAAFTPAILRKSGVTGVSEQVGKNVTVHPGFRMIARFDEPVRGWEGALQSVFTSSYERDGLTLTGLFIPPAVLAATMPGLGPELLHRAQHVPNLAIFGGMIHDEGGGRIWPGLGREPFMTYRMSKEDRARVPHIIRVMGEAFLAAGAKEVFPPVLGAPAMDADAFRKYPFERVPGHLIECSSQHPLGSTRMGKTREHSVVDTMGQVWDTRGLHIADGGIIPTSLGVNPQISIMTLATRIAFHLREQRAAGSA
jgi:choline dehydrogenase-like flavoprotein